MVYEQVLLGLREHQKPLTRDHRDGTPLAMHSWEGTARQHFLHASDLPCTTQSHQRISISPNFCPYAQFLPTSVLMHNLVLVLKCLRLYGPNGVKFLVCTNHSYQPPSSGFLALPSCLPTLTTVPSFVQEVP